MNIPLITHLITLIEEIFKAHGKEVVEAAGEAAAGAAIQTAEADPKVAAVTEASVALLAAAQSLKAAIDARQSAPAEEPKPEEPAA